MRRRVDGLEVAHVQPQHDAVDDLPRELEHVLVHVERLVLRVELVEHGEALRDGLLHVARVLAHRVGRHARRDELVHRVERRRRCVAQEERRLVAHEVQQVRRGRSDLAKVFTLAQGGLRDARVVGQVRRRAHVDRLDDAAKLRKQPFMVAHVIRVDFEMVSKEWQLLGRMGPAHRVAVDFEANRARVSHDIADRVERLIRSVERYA